MKKMVLASSLLMVIGLGSCDSNRKAADTNLEERGSAIIDNMLTRRSIRKYTQTQVSAEQLETITQCAIYAPSALNKQSWEIRVVQNASILKNINERFVEYARGKQMAGSAARAAQPGFSVFHGAPTLVVVGKDKSNGYSAVDCGLMAQNILLSAHALGLGTCVIGSVAPVMNSVENTDILDRIDMPATHDVAFAIALGYPDENPAAKDRMTEKVKIIE